MTKLMMTLLFISLSSNVMAKSGPIKVGMDAPEINLSDINKRPFKLSQAIKKGPVAIVFYRGGWCPYCNIQLREIQADLVPQLKKLNAQVVAISADKIDEGVKTQKNNKLAFTILSDSGLSAHKAYRVMFKVPQKLVTKYKNEYKIDLEKSSGEKHHTIAIPSVFVVNKMGKVIFSHSDENYKVRAQNQDILKALRSAS